MEHYKKAKLDQSRNKDDIIKKAIRDGEEYPLAIKFALYPNSCFNNYLIPLLGSSFGEISPKEWWEKPWVIEGDREMGWLWEEFEKLGDDGKKEFEEFRKKYGK